jgi:hypothetical protein
LFECEKWFRAAESPLAMCALAGLCEILVWELPKSYLDRRTGYSRQHAGRVMMVVVAVVMDKRTHELEARRERDCCQSRSLAWMDEEQANVVYCARRRRGHPEGSFEAVVSVRRWLGFAGELIASSFIPGQDGIAHVDDVHLDGASSTFFGQLLS